MSTYYLGIDLHKKRSFAVLMDHQGEIIEECGLANDQVVEFLTQKVPAATIGILEATWNWQFMYDLMSEHCQDVKLAHPQKVKMIAEATVKTDKIDARTLAHLARTGYLPTAYAAPKEIRHLRQIVRHRLSLIADRTQHKNRIHAALVRYNLVSPVSDLFGCKGRQFLDSLRESGLPRTAQQVVDDHLALIDFINERLVSVDQMLKEYADQDKDTALLETLPGVALITAVTIRAELGEVERFRTARHAARWAGLTPKVHASDETVQHGPISRQGSPYLRAAMVGAALRAPRYSPALRRFHQRIARRRGNGMARVALARKMLIIAYTMLRNGQPYQEAGRSVHQGA